MSEHDDFIDRLFSACVCVACIVAVVVIAIIGGMCAPVS